MSEKWFKVMTDGRFSEVNVTRETENFILIDGKSAKTAKTQDGYCWYGKTLNEAYEAVTEYHKDNVRNHELRLSYANSRMQEFLDKRFAIMSVAGLEDHD